jgi:hypothetical protein
MFGLEVAFVAEGIAADPDAVATLIAFRVGFGTPRGFILPLKFVELISLMDNQPKVSQYRPLPRPVDEPS